MPNPVSFDPPPSTARHKLESLPTSSPFSSPMYSNYPRYSPYDQSINQWSRPNTAPPMSPLALQPQHHHNQDISQSPEIAPMSSPFAFQPYQPYNQPRLRQHVLHDENHDYSSSAEFCRNLPYNHPNNRPNNQYNDKHLYHDKQKPSKWNWTMISVVAAVILIVINLVLLVYLITSINAANSQANNRAHHVDPAHALRDESLMAAVEDYEAHMRQHRREAAQAAQDLANNSVNNQSNGPSMVIEDIHDNLHEGAEPIAHQYD